MKDEAEIKAEEVDRLYETLKKQGERMGYFLNPDEAFTKDLVKGLLVNERRYGYWACPCRLASGEKDEDLDIICPCDYRDRDLLEYNACYCALYVSQAVLRGETKVKSIPERRPPAEERHKKNTQPTRPRASSMPLPVWRCRVCGYLCGREGPPETCPICKASKERFEKFM
jgi:ferredoxin-thioredoxin reductase catalytic chain